MQGRFAIRLSGSKLRSATQCWPWLLLLLTSIIWCSLASTLQAAEGILATVHPLATAAGRDAFRQGGNAVDAAVAAALALGVVDGHNSGIGGGCFVVIRLADGRLLAVDGRETAPAAATRDMYLRDGKPQPELSRAGPLASGVPGSLAAYDLCVRQFGRLALKQLLLPAARLAEEGFAIDRNYAERLAATAEDLAKYPATRAVLLKPDGSPYAQGEVLRQPDLARTYRAIAERGVGWFYRGPFAHHVGRWMADNGGILTAEDFAAYRPRRREPIVSTYRGYTIVGFPPPSSGGVHVAQILNILEAFDLKRLHAENPAEFYHVVAEAMKLAFADRAHWLGDPDFAQVPRGLVDKRYAARLARGINRNRAATIEEHGLPPNWKSDHFGKHTTHFSAVDREGNWVAVTATVNLPFGSQVIVPGTGVILNNQMDDFATAPGVPNAFGLIGAEANAVAPGKRPLSSMSPTVVLRDGRPALALGAAGGPAIISQVVLTIVRRLDLGMALPAAVAAPRIHHQWRPDELVVETALCPAVGGELKRRGHRVRRRKSIGVTQAIALSDDGEDWIAVRDPRLGGDSVER